MKILGISPPPTLEEQVLDYLREAIIIVAGVFEPESQVNQVQLAAQFGVSYSPLRAVIRKPE